MMKRISDKEINDLLLKYQYKLRNDLKFSQSDNTEIFELETGNLLVRFLAEQRGLFCESVDEWIEFKAGLTKPPNAKHILQDLYTDSVHFLQVIESSPTRLSELLNMPADNLNYSFKSLKLIDYKFKENGINQGEYFEHYFYLLVPYVGNTICKEIHAEWVFSWDVNANLVFEPAVRSGERTIPYFIDLYEDAMEDFKSFSVFETSVSRITFLD